MKLTWFGGTTIRIHIGGRILVAGATGIDSVDPGELVSGADVTFSLDAGLPQIDPVLWQPGRAGSMLDEERVPEVLVHALDGGALVATPGEPPLLLLTGEPGRIGRWVRDAVVVVFGAETARRAGTVLEEWQPRLIALAADEQALEPTFAALRDRLAGTVLVALEPGLSLEV